MNPIPNECTSVALCQPGRKCRLEHTELHCRFCTIQCLVINYLDLGLEKII